MRHFLCASLILCFAPLAAAQAQETADGERVESEMPEAPPPPKAKRKKRPRFQGKVVKETELRSEPFARPSGDLYVYSPNLHEEVKVNIYKPDGSFNQDAVRELYRVFRCKRTDTEKPIEPRLIEILSSIQDHFGGRRMEVISGFRNQRKVTSFHFHGTAADIRIDGIAERQVRDYASSLDTGGMGVGIYPRAHFVHVDVRPEPSFRWTDYSASGDGSPGRLPPRGFKKKPTS